MKRKISFIFIVMFLAVFAISCGIADTYIGISNDVKNYKTEFVYLNSDEEYVFDIEKQFALSGIDITKYELNCSDEDVASIRKNKIVAKNTGKVSIGVTLYERETQTRYVAKVADVYVVNTKDMIEIRTAEDLANINNNKSGHFILKNDIDLSVYESWTPIGRAPRGNEFTGVLVNPDGYKIKNLTVTPSTSTYSNGNDLLFTSGGLFGEIANAYIDGLILENVYIDVEDKEGLVFSASAGGFANSIFSSVIRNSRVEGTVIAETYAGGIVGTNSWGYIFDCTFEGIVKTVDNFEGYNGLSGAGGIVGHSGTMENIGLIKNCSAVGTIIGRKNAGGIVGINLTYDNIEDCKFEGTVEATYEPYNQLTGKVHR